VSTVRAPSCAHPAAASDGTIKIRRSVVRMPSRAFYVLTGERGPRIVQA
jgi:hypothetical protein